MGLENFSEYRTKALSEYRELLGCYKNMRRFHYQMVALIDKYSLFPPPYIEVLEQFEGLNRQADYRAFLHITAQRFDTFFTEHRRVSKFVSNWNFDELWSFRNILQRIKAFQQSNPLRLSRFLGVERAVLAALSQVQLPTTHKHLDCIDGSVDVAGIIKELRHKEHFWYADIARQSSIYNHRHTHAIILRSVQNKTEKPIRVDGDHESVLTDIGQQFPDTVKIAEQFAKTLKSGLGRVALIQLAPQKMVYRHVDGEIYLRNRSRYHLTVTEGAGNLLISGTEAAWIKQRELWFFDNKASHKAYNNSDTPRINLIFDVFLLQDSSPAS